MAIYDSFSNKLNTAYDIKETVLPSAYSVDGSKVFPDEEPVIPTAYLKVMSYNVGQWYNGTLTAVPADQYETYYNLQRDMIADNEIDLMACQEYSATFSSGHTTDSVIGEYFTDSAKNSESGYQRKAIYSNGYILNDVVNANYEGYTWGYQKARIVVDGKDVWIFNTHLATSSTESQKVAQAQMLFDMVSELERFIIFGDFNTVCLSTSDTEYTTIMKQFVDAGYNVASCSEQFGFNLTWTESTDRTGVWYPCDHIITSSNIVMSDVMVDYSKVEVSSVNGVRIDHCPIVATLGI